MANTKNPILTPDDIEYWKRKINPKTGKPYTQREIADIHGVTPSYVSWIKRNKARSFSQTPREHVMEHYPWNVGATFHDAPQNKRMRDHAEYMWTGGDGMSEEKIQRLFVVLEEARKGRPGYRIRPSYSTPRRKHLRRFCVSGKAGIRR